MEYIRNHIPKGTIRPGTKLNAISITIHSTGNPSSTARNERGWLTNPSNTRIASWHICVDDKEAVEAIPLNEIAYHAGDRKGNAISIGIEICESGNREKTLTNTVRLVAGLLKEKGWGIERLKRHYDWSGKVCPRIMSANNWQGWDDFVNRVRKEMTNVSEQPSPWAKDAWEWAKKEGLLDGTQPKEPLTREMLAVVLQKVLKK